MSPTAWSLSLFLTPTRGEERPAIGGASRGRGPGEQGKPAQPAPGDPGTLLRPPLSWDWEIYLPWGQARLQGCLRVSVCVCHHSTPGVGPHQALPPRAHSTP